MVSLVVSHKFQFRITLTISHMPVVLESREVGPLVF